MTDAPRILLAAPASGGGKTTVTCALLQALVNRGADPVAFKCGPDYIDPMFHSEIIGAKSRNLDLFFLGEDGTRALLAENAAGAGLAVVEGVMGYYDGVALSSRASAYDLARATRTPAVLVVDGRGAALSAAALVKGFQSFRADSGLRGVILNRVSPMLYPRLKQAVEEETGLAVYGFLPNLPGCALESRHLGLVTAGEVADLKGKLAALAQQAEQTLDIDGLLALGACAPPLGPAHQTLPAPVAGRPRIAVARDRAFCFYYADGLRLLEQLGAELVEFSPLEDGGLPREACGLYLGGGYPELCAGELSANAPMRRAVRAAVAGGMPTVAECGGFLYLHETLEGADGGDYPMAGVISARAYRTDKLGRFGYVTLTAKGDSLLCRAGEELPAHEFHYWESTDPGGAFSAQKPLSDRGWACGHAGPAMYAGFPHFHFCARPESAKRFVSACARYREEIVCPSSH
ncbi:cobyrinic acid a,c-diamide synthase [Oscillospiraceae bacterium]|nr:cobyrinic acid a,c-diamide synthase [Oscillospiraceae bacterium]BDF74554.1 cobyrinic acid a,c-diamide synthase [Oscillospiraceae bacterium]